MKDDTISRQAAIDALKNMCSEDENGITVSRANVDSMLRVLPSAQTTQCKYWDSEGGFCAQTTVEPTLYGYRVAHLAFIAGMMAKEKIPPEKVIEVLSDAGRVVEMVLAEQKEIMEQEVKRWMI